MSAVAARPLKPLPVPAERKFGERPKGSSWNSFNTTLTVTPGSVSRLAELINALPERCSVVYVNFKGEELTVLQELVIRQLMCTCDFQVAPGRAVLMRLGRTPFEESAFTVILGGVFWPESQRPGWLKG